MKTIIGLVGALAFVLPLAYALAATPTSNEARTVADFTSDDSAAAWLSVNDNVMGGVSSGGFQITEKGTLLFTGNISLENRGGFASIRTRPTALGLEGYSVMAVRVKGDGRTYYLDLRTSGNAAGSYRAPLETVNDTWREFRIPLETFEFAAFGRRIASAQRLEAGNIQSVGFTLADSQSGPFRMEVDWIRGEIPDAHNADVAPLPASASELSDIIELAIARGVPLFNAGQPAACAAIYEVTVVALLKSHAGTLTGPQRSVLESAIDEMRREQDAAEKAWILRRAMDSVHRDL